MIGNTLSKTVIRNTDRNLQDNQYFPEKILVQASYIIENAKKNTTQKNFSAVMPSGNSPEPADTIAAWA